MALQEQAGWFVLRFQAKLRESKSRAVVAIESEVQQHRAPLSVELSKVVQALFKPRSGQPSAAGFGSQVGGRKGLRGARVERMSEDMDDLLEEYQEAVKAEAMGRGERREEIVVQGRTASTVKAEYVKKEFEEQAGELQRRWFPNGCRD